jgi:RNase P subunit RPR2
MVQESEIILLQKKLLKAIEASSKNQNCKKCGKKGQKVILLYETNEIIPSQLVLYCSSCETSENFPIERSGDVLKFVLILERKMAEIINENKKSKIEE